MAELDIRTNAKKSRYEAWTGGVRAGRVDFQLTDGVVVFTHTVVEPEFRGRGVASTLIRGALDDVRMHGERLVVPLCGMVRAFIDRHPDYEDLVKPGHDEG